MKKLMFILAVLFCGVSFVQAGQRTESFSWTYTAEEEAKIDGFYIFMDGGSIDNIVWEGIRTNRMATITFDDSKKSHAFSITAFINNDDSTITQSDQSSYVIWVLPKYKLKRPTGFISD